MAKKAKPSKSVDKDVKSETGDEIKPIERWIEELTSAKSAAKKYRRVDASKIIHVYERLRPGQTRGEPPAAAAVNP